VAQDFAILLANFCHPDGAGLAHATPWPKPAPRKTAFSILDLDHEQRAAQPTESLADAQLATDGFTAGRPTTRTASARPDILAAAPRWSESRPDGIDSTACPAPRLFASRSSEIGRPLEVSLATVGGGRLVNEARHVLRAHAVA